MVIMDPCETNLWMTANRSPRQGCCSLAYERFCAELTMACAELGYVSDDARTSGCNNLQLDTCEEFYVDSSEGIPSIHV